MKWRWEKNLCPFNFLILPHLLNSGRSKPIYLHLNVPSSITKKKNSFKICKSICDTGYTKVHLRGLMELHYHLMVGPISRERDPVIIVFKWRLIKVGKMLYVTRKMHSFAKLFDQVNISFMFHKVFLFPA